MDRMETERICEKFIEQDEEVGGKKNNTVDLLSGLLLVVANADRRMGATIRGFLDNG